MIQQQTKTTKLFIACIVILCVAACAPTSKESYLRRFDAFITEVSKNHRTFSERDWERATQQFERFSGEWYDRFRDNFTLREIASIRAKQIRWHYFLRLNQASSFLESLNVRELKRQVQSFIDENSTGDLLQLYDEAVRAGQDVQNAINEILRELQININDLR